MKQQSVNRYSTSSSSLRPTEGPRSGPKRRKMLAPLLLVGLALLLGAGWAGGEAWTRSQASGLQQRICPPIRVESGPTTMVAAGRGIWVVNQGADAVSQVYTAACAVRHVLHAADVGGLAYDGRHVWAADTLGRITEIDAKRGVAVGSLTLDEFYLALAFDGRHLWAAASAGSVPLLEVDPASRKVVHRVRNPGVVGSLTYEHGRLWVSELDLFSRGALHSAVWEFGVARRTVIRRVGVPPYGGPAWSVFDGKHLWVVLQDTGKVLEIDAASGRKLALIHAGKALGGIAFDGKHVWVASGGTNSLTEISVSGRRVIGTVRTGRNPPTSSSPAAISGSATTTPIRFKNCPPSDSTCTVGRSPIQPRGFTGG